MKENILNRIQKYYTGGPPDTSKGFSLAMRGLKPLFTGAASRSLGPLSLMLGAGKLNANEYNNSSNPVTMPSGNIMDNIMTALPEGSSEVNVDSVNTELGNIMNPYKRQMGGVEPLPGGVMAPIPGSDAVEFVGNKHDESGMGSNSGIMLDQQTEVEGGETMDEVVMNKGGARDYFFSDHLKKGGMSYAQHHKNILQNGGGQQEINMLAKLQEKAANRDPKQVAKLGGVVKYEEGGLSDLEKAKRLTFMLQNNPEYTIGANNLLNESGVQPPLPFGQRFDLPSKQDLESIYSAYQRQRQINEATPYNTTTYGPNFSPQNLTVPPNNMGLTPIGGNFAPNVNYGGNNPLDLDRRTREQIQPIDLQPRDLQQIPNEMPEQELAQSTDINKGIPKFISAGPGRMDYIKNPDYFEPYEPSALNDAGVVGMSQEEVDLAGGIDNTYDAYLARTQMSGEIPEGGVLSEKKYNRQQKIAARKLNRKLNPGMPQAAKIGLAAAFIPTIGAMLTKQKDLEKFEYTPGFESPIVAGRVKGQVYDAPNQNEARARLASAYTGEQRFLDTSGAGSSAFANRQALFAKKLQAEGTLGAQESKDQITAENLTKKSAEQAEARNVQNELTAATTNAQLIQREADRRAAVDNANVTAKNMRESEKISNRMAILNTLGQGIGTVMGDKMAYASQERMAKAIGSDGIYQRDILSKYLAKQNPHLSPDEINLLTIETLNNLQANKKN